MPRYVTEEYRYCKKCNAFHPYEGPQIITKNYQDAVLILKLRGINAKILGSLIYQELPYVRN